MGYENPKGFPVPTPIRTEKQLFDLADSLTNYTGSAPLGSASSAPKWRIRKVSFDAGGNLTSIQWSGPNSVWDDRVSIPYT